MITSKLKTQHLTLPEEIKCTQHIAPQLGLGVTGNFQGKTDGRSRKVPFNSKNSRGALNPILLLHRKKIRVWGPYAGYVVHVGPTFQCLPFPATMKTSPNTCHVSLYSSGVGAMRTGLEMGIALRKLTERLSNKLNDKAVSVSFLPQKRSRLDYITGLKESWGLEKKGISSLAQAPLSLLDKTFPEVPLEMLSGQEFGTENYYGTAYDKTVLDSFKTHKTTITNVGRIDFFEHTGENKYPFNDISLSEHDIADEDWVSSESTIESARLLARWLDLMVTIPLLAAHGIRVTKAYGAIGGPGRFVLQSIKVKDYPNARLFSYRSLPSFFALHPSLVSLTSWQMKLAFFLFQDKDFVRFILDQIEPVRIIRAFRGNVDEARSLLLTLIGFGCKLLSKLPMIAHFKSLGIDLNTTAEWATALQTGAGFETLSIERRPEDLSITHARDLRKEALRNRQEIADLWPMTYSTLRLPPALINL